MQETDLATSWRVELADEAATDTLAQSIATWIKAGDLLTLSGDLGAGKTTFARTLIRALTGDPELEVPSPTFTLMQIYETAAFPIVHADLYRIKSPDELVGLGWDEAAEGALVLVEWPERASTSLKADRLDIAFHIESGSEAQHRVATLTGTGSFAPRLAQAKGTTMLLARAGWSDSERLFMQGDASTRHYERLVKADGTQCILMSSPPRPDGPVVRHGKPYSGVARLAETIKPFIAIDQGLRERGFSAPEILAYDLEAGLALLEDLGPHTFFDMQSVDMERYGEATALLARLHGMDLPASIAISPELSYTIPPYDAEALMIEIELLLDWYAPHAAKVMLTSGPKASFINLWRHTLNEIIVAPPTWTLRDYHSPNLIWLPAREGVARVGVIDFQDCVLGHKAYDVVSLLQDARMSVPDDVELKLLGHYARLRREADPNFDMANFARAYAILGAQRATKILGIFARLDKRDRKPQYLAHLPRIQSYLAKSLTHPALADLKAWYEANLPQAISRIA